MRRARLIGEGTSHYHCMSRVVDGRFIFGEEEKAFFVSTVRKLEAFCGVRVVTFCVMSNHFHLLVEVPDREGFELADEELFSRVRALSGRGAEAELRQEVGRFRARGQGGAADAVVASYAARMLDLSRFMKDLKQRFTQWFNRREGRRGTLWEDRFKSVLVEGGEDALLAMAAYIDLNPVRAGLVADPAEYRWSGYGEACAGRKRARLGLAVVLEASGRYAGRRLTWREVGARYRQLLYGVGEERGVGEDGRPLRRGFSPEEVAREMAGGGRLPLGVALRCRVRYFSDGAVLGTRAFVESVFEANRPRYGPRRKSGARKMRGAEWGELRVLRDLRKEVFG